MQSSNIRYWAFCGGEGAGKTVISKAFAERCGAVWTYEPNGETPDLKTLRHLALLKNDHMTTQARELILLANRSIHQRVHVLPYLENKNTVVTDRSFLSGLVYAKLNGYSFTNWLALYEMANIRVFPEAVIYCRVKERKIDKEENNIYDHAPEETLNEIDRIYEEALEFIKKHPLTKNIKVLEFFNDFTKSVDKNVDKLIKQIKKEIIGV